MAELDLTQIEALMVLARKHGASAVRFRGVSIVMGEAPKHYARPIVLADTSATEPAPAPTTPLGEVIKAAMETPDEEEMTPEDEAAVAEFRAWQFQRSA